MVRTSVVLKNLGKIISIIGLAIFSAAVISLCFGEAIFERMMLASLITMGTGTVIILIFKNDLTINYREGFAVVTLGWLAASLFGTLPYLLSGYVPSFADALFETVSGFTTTGASIFADVEGLPRSLLYWRSLTQWLGGMGIMALFIAIIANIGARANQIFRAEVPGPVSDKISPRIRETAKILWITYLIMSAVLVVLLYVFGMDWFNSVCHTFTTMSTGGFSTRNSSLANFNPLIQWTIIIFMFLAGANFALHYLAFRKRSLKGYLLNSEFRLYSLLVIIASAIVFTGIGQYPGIEERIRQSAFQVVSIITTTGFVTADYNIWSPVSQVIILALMLVGGCAGSTAGNIKVSRYIILIEQAKAEIKQMVHPKSIWPVRYGNKPLNEALVINVLQFFFLYLMIVVTGVVVLSVFGLDLISSISASLSCMGNIGPGFNLVGPVQNYGHLPDISKYVLSGLMFIGRLEIYPVLVLFSPLFWKE
ncbi:MAG TPA: TrkH family potassium uptake protein [Syntrophomonadaceae bacterium]|nr:TrkH family potassium uptake protein [Syntrophomonadaceae bacterium]HPR93511.1 TrkH family potassium uptake protein [Syntrophomonadaceae bacterium]